MSKRKLITKSLRANNTLLTDAVTLTAMTGASEELRDILLRNSANEFRASLNPLEKLNLIFEDKPAAFNYNGNLMVKGSELLKYPQLYTNRGWVNTKGSLIVPDLYYKFSLNGLFDPNHFTAFSNTDTYTPIPNQYLLQILNQAFTLNNKYGLYFEREKLGNISLKSNLEINPVLTGFVPGVDALYYDANNPLAYIDAMAGLTAILNTALGFTGPGFTFTSPLIFNSGYDRFKLALDWKDYALGGTEMLLSVAPWLYKGYAGIKGLINPNYRLALAMDKSLEYPDFDFYNSPYKISDYIREVPDIGSTRDLHATYGTRFDWNPKHYARHFIDLPSIEEMNEALENGFKLSKKRPEDLLPGESTTIMGTVSGSYPVGITHVRPRFSNINFDRTNEPRFDNGSLGFTIGTPSRVRLHGLGNDNLIIDIPTTPQYILDLADSDELTNTLKFLVTNEDGQLRVATVYPAVLGYEPGKTTIPAISRAHSKAGISGENPRFTEALRFWDTHLLHLSEFNRTTPELMLLRFPDYLFDPSKVDPPTVTGAKEMGEVARDKAVKDVRSPEYREHLRRELGPYSHYRDIPDILAKRYGSVSIYGIDPRPNDYPAGATGIAEYMGVNGPGIHNDLQIAGKIPRGKTESWYTQQLDPAESAAYYRAKLRKPVVEIQEGDASARYNIAQEEMNHVPDLNEYLPIDEAPPMKQFDAHNKPIIDAIIANRPLFGGKEFLPRAREAQRAYRMVKNRLSKYYIGKTSMDVERRFYQQLLNGDESLFKAFPELREFHPRQNRLIWELNHEYRLTPAFWNGVEHIVYNEVPTNNINIT